jgi:hypothetical protein
MANYFARKAGDIDAVDVWATTPTGTAADVWPTFTSADVLHSNSFAITVNVDTTVGEVRNDNANGATAGGGFALSNGVTLTANAQAGSTSTACVTYAGTAGNSASIVGNCTGGTVGNSPASIMSGGGVLNITGNCTGGASNALNANGATLNSGGTINITGNCVGSSTNPFSFGARILSTGSINIVGNCTGGGSGAGAANSSTGSLTITGDVTGSASAAVVGASNSSTGTLTINGTITASEFAAGVGGESRSQVTLLTGPFISSPTFGVNPITCVAWRWAASLNDQTYIEVPTNDLLATRNLVTPDNATNFPAPTDVRSGTTFGISGALTGTCAVPPAASVATGVPVDNTTGTAALTPADFWNAPTSGMTTAGSIGARLKNAATLDSTGQQLADALSPVP